MSNRRTYPLGTPVASAFLSAGSLALALASSVSAQVVPPPAASEADSVIVLSAFEVSTAADRGYRAGNSVSATRVDTPIKDLPFSVSAFTEQFIDDIGARELMDVAIYAPGVTSGAKEFTQGNNRYSIRGFDGDVTPQRNGFIGNRYVDAANIQRVEIVKGPASLLYGQITPGGTVNYITKRPRDASFVAVKQQIGTDSFWRTELDANHAIMNGRVQGRLVGAYEKGFEWAEPGDSHSSLVAPSVAFRVTETSTLIVDFEKYRRRENPLVGMKPNLAVSVAPTAANFPNVDDRARAQAYIDVGNLNLGFMNYPPLPVEFNYVSDHDYRNSDFDSLNVEYTMNFGRDWTARANYAWNDYYIGNKLTGLAEFTVVPAAAYLATKNRFDYVREVQANPAAVLGDATKTASANLTRRKRIEESFGSSDSYQLEVAGRIDLGEVVLKPLFGGFISDQQGGARRRESNSAPPATLANGSTAPNQHFQPWSYLNPATWDRTPNYDEFSLPMNNNRRGDGTDSAVYGVLNASLLDERLILIGGARYNKTESDGINLLTNVPDAPYSATKTTPQVGAGFKLRPDLLLFASYSESFFVEERNLNIFNPTFNPAQPTTGANQVTISAPAEPTTGKGYEVGLKTDFFDGRISSTVSLFHLERENRVLRFRETVNVLEGQQFPTITRQGTVDESEGLEIEVTFSPLDHWQIYATATFMDISTTKFTPPAIPANASAAYVAAYNEAVRLIRGAVPEGSAETLGSLWTRYTVPSGALKDVWFGGGFVYTGEKAQRTANPTLFFDKSTIVDAVVGYDWKWNNHDMSATLSWKNVTDKEYFPANQARGLPERFILSVSARF